MKKTKVIEFIQTMGDGGAETLVKDYVQLLDKEQFEVCVVVMHGVENSANLQRLKEQNINIIELSSQNDLIKRIWHRVFWRKEKQLIQSEDVKEKPVLPGETYEKENVIRCCRNYIRNLYFGMKFLKVLRRNGATVVHAHLDMLGCLSSVRWFLKGVRLFHTCHALPDLVYAGDEGRAAHRLICGNQLQLIALHEEMASEMDKMFPEQKTQTIRNGINIHLFQNPGVTKDVKRRELLIPQDAFVVGHIGRFTPEKNHMFLIDIFREITCKQENAFLLMVGAGNTDAVTQKLEEYGLKDRYLVLSHRKDISELLNSMDVFVFPSIFEGFGIALLEAQAAGLRCVASDSCPEAVCRTENCISISLNTPASEWADIALDEKIIRHNALDLHEYDMNREIRRLEKLYQG